MLILTDVEVNKYKSFLSTQSTSIEKNITAFVGKNESGKTAFLEALAKFNYFQDDPKYKFDVTSDFPRTELKKYQKSDEQCEVIKCTFKISDELLSKINKEIGTDIKLCTVFSYGIKYDGDPTWYGLSADESLYINHLVKLYDIPEIIKKDIIILKSINSLMDFIQQIDYSLYPDINVEESTAKINKLNEGLTKLKTDSYAWDNLLKGYIAKKYLRTNFPKILVF